MRMFELNLNKILQDIVSTDIDAQCLALDDFHQLTEAVIEQAVKGLEISEAPDLVIERIANLGYLIIKKLEDVVEKSQNSEKKVLASTALLFLGSDKGLDNLIREVAEHGKYEISALSALTKAKVENTEKLIIARLREFTQKEIENEKTSIYVNSLVVSLEELGLELPDDIYKRLEAANTSAPFKYYSISPKPTSND